jgi:hypothetical protein
MLSSSFGEARRSASGAKAAAFNLGHDRSVTAWFRRLCFAGFASFAFDVIGRPSPDLLIFCKRQLLIS